MAPQEKKKILNLLKQQYSNAINRKDVNYNWLGITCKLEKEISQITRDDDVEYKKDLYSLIVRVYELELNNLRKKHQKDKEKDILLKIVEYGEKFLELFFEYDVQMISKVANALFDLDEFDMALELINKLEKHDGKISDGLKDLRAAINKKKDKTVELISKLTITADEEERKERIKSKIFKRTVDQGYITYDQISLMAQAFIKETAFIDSIYKEIRSRKVKLFNQEQLRDYQHNLELQRKLLSINEILENDLKSIESNKFINNEVLRNLDQAEDVLKERYVFRLHELIILLYFAINEPGIAVLCYEKYKDQYKGYNLDVYKKLVEYYNQNKKDDKALELINDYLGYLPSEEWMQVKRHEIAKVRIRRMNEDDLKHLLTLEKEEIISQHYYTLENCQKILNEFPEYTYMALLLVKLYNKIEKYDFGIALARKYADKIFEVVGELVNMIYLTKGYEFAKEELNRMRDIYTYENQRLSQILADLKRQEKAKELKAQKVQQKLIEAQPSLNNSGFGSSKVKLLGKEEFVPVNSIENMELRQYFTIINFVANNSEILSFEEIMEYIAEAFTNKKSVLYELLIIETLIFFRQYEQASTKVKILINNTTDKTIIKKLRNILNKVQQFSNSIEPKKYQLFKEYEEIVMKLNLTK